ncbi:DEAD/DEAH box helicase [Patulibacter americanus]|uniref:DEAD/DEAH box helicase n=1 Tax=Patulibacter americanus TaxID=588672 RepID=UPI0003B79DDE|nr:DEAD/DEAH box helicase family protein [Patulibacter americanus]
MPGGPTPWTGPDGAVASHINDLNQQCLAAYAANPALVEEHANAERIQTDGGYGRRQVWELIQNGADEMIDDPGRVEVILTDEHLYCANHGRPVTPKGAGAILSAYRSAKRGPEIGRFGLGFKSVLGVSDRPEFFSRSGSFGFDPTFAAESVRSVLSDVVDVPILRLARNLDAPAAAAGDPILAALFEWATTVVRLPLDRGRGDWLHGDLEQFKSQFLVFSPHISELVLDDRVKKHRRAITLERAGDHRHLLKEGAETDEWRVFTKQFAPSTSAARDGGAMANRKSISLQWAVPIRSRQRIGGLWAYFPTLEDTTLSGVLNAPWKLNDDRTRVIEGPFNTEILEHACDLVLENLETLVVDDDPGSVLDILPARGREERNWADGFVTERLNDRAPHHPSIPDQQGRLAPPDDLTLHPKDLPKAALHLWAKVPGRPTDWAHPSVDANQTRRSRAERFIAASTDGATATTGQWIQALIPDFKPGEPPLQASGFAVLVAAQAVGTVEFRQRIRETPFVVDAEGVLAAPADLVLPGDSPTLTPSVRLVHPVLARHKKARPALEALGILPVDAALELEIFLQTFRPKSSRADWDSFWSLAGRSAPNDALQLLAAAGIGSDLISVKVVSGRFIRLPMTLLPGQIARADAAPDVTVDVHHHREHLNLIRLLGAVTAPAGGAASEHEPAMRDFLERTRMHFVAKAGKANPDPTRIEISTRAVAGPISPLAYLDDDGKVAFTRALLEAQGTFPATEVSYPQNRYPSITVDHPVIDAVRRNGLAQTSAGLVGPASWVGPRLQSWRQVLPVARIPMEASAALNLPETLEDLSDAQWVEAFGRLAATLDVGLAQRFYIAAARAGADRPTHLLVPGDGVAVESDAAEVRVTSSKKTASVLRAGGQALLEVAEDDAEMLVERWSLIRGDDEIATTVVAIESVPRIALVDLFPALRPMLPEAFGTTVVARCSELRIETSGAGGRESEATLVHVADGVAFLDDGLELEQILVHLGPRLGLDLDRARITRIIENKLDGEIRRRQLEVRNAPDEATKLSIVVSEERLRTELPASLLTATQDLAGTPDHVALARLAFAVHGVETLKVFASDFEDAGLQPPRRWSASREALEFVRRLKFEDEHAGFPAAQREPVLEVSGPPGLNDLHEYQRAVVDEIHALLTIDPKEGRPRGIVSLPTGAGKTRVAIEALIEAVRDGTLGSPILWVAQRDELCEQAVQAWSELWRDRGPQTRLTISRLWRNNEAEPPAEGAHVVVATIDKLGSGVFEKQHYEWLSRATCIVIDEAHFAISPSYTQLLEWQGMDRRKERAPLIGLTATPYRGISEVDTERLVNRFGKRRLDRAAFGERDPYEALQEMGVLSRAEHRVLKGTDIALDDKEFAELKRTRLLPSSAGDRLANNLARNRELLHSIESQPDDWTTLVFCASLEHAAVMAGLLTSRGIPAATVSGRTPPAARRHYVEEFKAGRLKVITNYAVFQEGFDAPMVRAVYVARPTYSPNVYQQMVGRGLRGPKNGGSPECLIVNVADTVENFGEELAFRGFEHLWDAGVGSAGVA